MTKPSLSRRDLFRLGLVAGPATLAASCGWQGGPLMPKLGALSLWFSDYFRAGAVVSWGGVALGSGGSMLAALAASLLPAWSATRVDPLEAMSPLSAAASHRPPIVAMQPPTQSARPA